MRVLGKPLRGWACLYPGDEIIGWSVTYTRRGAIREATEAYGEPWEDIKRKYGLRVARVTIALEQA